MMIDPPKSSDDYPDRLIDCQAAMEIMFQRMVEFMREAGWRPGEIEAAAVQLAIASRRTRIANAKTLAQIEIARAMERAKR